MTDIVDMEEALAKTGAELFKELYRIYPVADPEDYFKAGQWRNEAMKTDIVLIESHRRECGAPDVPDLEDIKAPALPAHLQQLGPTSFTSFAQSFSVAKPVGQSQGTSPLVATAGGGAVAGSAPVVEIRLIALFVAKWKLDPTTSKQVLAKLTPTRRRFVIQNFKTTKSGAEASGDLEEYIAQCEKDKTWDATAGDKAGNGSTSGLIAPTINTVGPPKFTAGGGAAIAAAKASVVRPPAGTVGPTTTKLTPTATVVSPAAPAVSGLKRPLTPTVTVASSPAWQQNKRPALVLGAGAGAKAGIVRPPATVRPPTMVRPLMGKAPGQLLKPGGY